MLGYVGLTLLVSSYILLVTKYSKWFIPIDILASVLLAVHAYLIQDLPFLLVNSLISGFLLIKLLQKKYI
jgi:Na+-translocating ferredoxin:NAD+ oxidoreductase RnfD subunit